MPNPPSRARRLPPPAPWSMARCWCWYSTSFFRRHFSSNGQTMSTSKNRVDLAVGVFLLLAFATLMVLAISSTNGRLPVLDAASYKVTARFSNISELRVRAPVKIGGVRVGEISNIRLDPKTFEAVVTLELGRSAGDIPADSSASEIGRAHV